MVSGKPWLQQLITKHAPCVRGPWTCLPKRLRQGHHALCRPLSPYVSHPGGASYAQQWLPSQCPGSPDRATSSSAYQPHADSCAQAPHPFSAQGASLRLGCGPPSGHRSGGLLPLRLRQAGDAEAAARAPAQQSGDFATLAL